MLRLCSLHKIYQITPFNLLKYPLKWKKRNPSATPTRGVFEKSVNNLKQGYTYKRVYLFIYMYLFYRRLTPCSRIFHL